MSPADIPTCAQRDQSAQRDPHPQGRDNDRYLRHPVPDDFGRPSQHITAEQAGWRFAGLHVVELAPGISHAWDLIGDEALVLPLAGSLEVRVEQPNADPVTVHLAGRTSPFDGPTDTLYSPAGCRLTVTSPTSAVARFALTTARASRSAARFPRHLPASAAARAPRGGGTASRLVTNYTFGLPAAEGEIEPVAVERLLVCEVITPGGNWSSYPPHKHEVHRDGPDGAERELEEIYYFEVASAEGPDGAARPGFAYHRTSPSPGHDIDVLAEVRTGDVALVPYGYHGPCIAAPGHDLYYLNVMAGPATDGTWLASDDPDLAWVRESWASQPLDPRLAVVDPLPPLAQESR